MSKQLPPPTLAIQATEVPARKKPSNYPPIFAARLAGRRKHPLGDWFGLTHFGINLTYLAPRATSALRHSHSRQDEFIYILQGNPTLISDAGEYELEAGMCAGFKAGAGLSHHLINRTQQEVVYLEAGDRQAGDEAVYPEDDLLAVLDEHGQWRFTHKDGSPY